MEIEKILIFCGLFWLAVAGYSLGKDKSLTISIGGGFISACLLLLAMGYFFNWGNAKKVDPFEAAEQASVTSALVAEKDAKNYSSMLRLVAANSRNFDTDYNKFIELQDALRQGKPIYAVQAEMKESVDGMLYSASQLQKCKESITEITNAAARKTISEGMDLLIAAYASKYAFAKDVREGLAVGTNEALKSVMNKHGERMKSVQMDAMKAMLYFAEAKKILGMPEDLSEISGQPAK